MTKNQVMLYKGLVFFKDSSQDNLAEAMSVQHMLLHYGWMLDEEGFNQLKKADIADIIDFKQDCEVMLKEMLGGKHDYTSLYKNFPNDILSMTDAEFYLGQIVHYWTHCEFYAVGKPKDPEWEYTKYKEIKGSTEEGILKIYKTLAGSGQSLTPMDIKVLKYFTTVKDLPIVRVGFKENLAVLASCVKGFKVATVVDVLRIACVIGDVEGGSLLLSIPKKLARPGYKSTLRDKERDGFKFKLKEEDKSRLLDLFEDSNLSLADLKQGSRYGRFIRLFEILKPNKETHPLTYKAVYHLRNQKRGLQKKKRFETLPKIRTWYSNVVKAFKKGFEFGVKKLSERPGEFLRKIDYLVRTNGKVRFELILQTLYDIGIGSSNKVLFEVYTHFEERMNPVLDRTVFVKGARERIKLPDLKALTKLQVDQIQERILDCIKDKMVKLPELGTCWIDEELKKIPLPTNMRSLSESMTPIIRGQRIPLTDKKVLRAFVHWFNAERPTDVDLHGYLLGTKNVQFGFNGRSNERYGCYSGDITSRSGACAEYVDINFEKSLEAGFKYYIQIVHSYSGLPWNNIKDCYTGLMTRQESSKNNTWVPKTVEHSFKLSSKSKYCLGGIVDLKTKEYIHLDLDWSNDFANACNSSDSKAFMNIIKPYITEPTLSVYDLLKWHVEARGNLVSIDMADTHFTYDDFGKDYVNILPYLGI